VTSGYLPLGGIMVTRRSSRSWMRSRPTIGDARVRELGAPDTARRRREHEIMRRERLGRERSTMAIGFTPASSQRSAIIHTPVDIWGARSRSPRWSSSRIVRRRKTRERPEVCRAPEGGDDEARRDHADPARARRPSLAG
jgi:hypothetical protein